MRAEEKWVDDFAEVFALCAVRPGEPAAILAETLSRRVLVELAERALLRLGARPFHLVVPSPRQAHPLPVRSTGTSLAVGGLEPVIAGLADAGFIVDCTVEGMLHAAERARILAKGARLLMISNEHPEILERTRPTRALRERVLRGMALLGAAQSMHVTSPAGTDLHVRIAGAPARGATGIVDEPGRVGYWPAGLCLAFPLPGTVSGRVVLAPGDVNLTFKRFVETPVTLEIVDDVVVAIRGDGVDAELLRTYYAGWNDPAAYATSHVGWGMNPAARWDAMTFHDRADHNGTELRAFAGNFLYSTGANENAGRFSACHFDFPMRNCTVTLDGVAVVERGVLCAALA